MDRSQIVRRSPARLTKSETGVYYAVWSACTGDTSKWRTKRVSTRETDLNNAKAFLNTWIAAQAQGDIEAVGDLVEAIADAYLTAVTRRGVSASQTWALKHPREILGDLTLSQITPERITRYWKVDRVGATDNTVRRELSALIAAFNWAAKTKRIALGDVPYVELPPAGTARQAFLTEAQEGTFLADVLSWKPNARSTRRVSWLGLFVALGLDTGARRAAIEGLTWERVDFVRQVIDFRDPGMRLTKKRRVAVPVAGRLAPILELARLDALDAAKGSGVLAGRVFEPVTIRVPWENFMRDHPQWAWVTPHVLRHTFITLGLRSGMSVWDVSGIAGASPTVVQQVYGHHSPDDRARALLDRRHASTSGVKAA